MRNFIVFAVMLGSATLGPALASTHDASACSPVREPEPVPPREQGIHSVAVSASGRLPRDGGILMVADVEGVEMSALLAKVTINVTAGGAPVTGELREFAVATGSPKRLSVQFLPTGGLLPATKELHVELAYEQAAGAPEAPKTFDGEVDDVRLTDLALPEMRLSLSDSFVRPDSSSPMIRCILKEPTTLRGSGGCGGPSTPRTITETTFPSKQMRLQPAELHVVGQYNYGVEQYVTYRSRLSWPGDPAGWEIGHFGDSYNFVVPASAKEEVCFEITADSKVLAGFPKTVKACQRLPEPSPISAAEDKAYFDKETAQCREVMAPPGVTLPPTTTDPSSGSPSSANGAAALSNDDEGCSVHGAPVGRATSGASAAALVLGLLLLGRRRSRT